MNAPSPAPAAPLAEYAGGLIRLDLSDPAVAVVTLSRADQKNAMSLAMWEGLGDAFEALSAVAEIRAIVLTGAGGAFCAGADIKEFGTVRADGAAAARYAAMVDRANLAILNAPKATFAAVSGPAMGGGCGLAVCCDFRVADRTGYFGIPAARLGLVYGIVETRAVVGVVGERAAKEMLFSARRYTAEQAHAIGLADEVAEGDALTAARARAEGLRASAPRTIAGAKAVLGALSPHPSAEAEARIAALQREAAESADYREGVAAFREKRAPQFHGR